MKKFLKCLLLILLFSTPVAFSSCDAATEEEVISDEFSLPGVWLMEGPLGVYLTDNGTRYDITTIYARLHANGDAEFIAFYDGKAISVAEGWWDCKLSSSSGWVELSYTNDKDYIKYNFKFAREYSAMLKGYDGDILMRRITYDVFEEALQDLYQDYNGIKKDWPAIIR